MSDASISVGRRIGLGVSAALIVALIAFFVDTSIDIWPSVGIHSELCAKAETIPEDKREAYLETIKREAKVNCKFGDIPIAKVNISGLKTFLSADQGMIGLSAIVALIGALLRSLLEVANAFRTGSKTNVSLPWIFLLPFMAAAVAVLAYLALRGLFLPSVSLTKINPYGFLTVSAFIGLFADQVLEWLAAASRALKNRTGS